MSEAGSACLVVGGGPAGLVAALALARHGVGVTLVAGQDAASLSGFADERTAAIFVPGLRALERLGVLDELARASAVVRGIRLFDGFESLLRSPEVVFAADDIGLERLGLNVPQAVLSNVLWARVGQEPAVHVVRGVVSMVVPDGDRIRVVLDDGRELSVRLVVAADGRRSVCRAGAGIGAKTWDYPQSAVVSRFFHSRSHGDVSTEIQYAGGPCTTVPMPGDQSSLVWVTSREEARVLAGLDGQTFSQTLESKLCGLLGSVSVCGPVQCFGLSGLSVEVLGRARVALVGEAAHVVPPVGAQGLNMGLADAAAIAELAGKAVQKGGDPGSAAVLGDYDAWRRGDVWRRTIAVDALNRSFVTAGFGGHLIRGAGLHALAAIGPFKRAVMLRGLMPDPLPSLMA